MCVVFEREEKHICPKCLHLIKRDIFCITKKNPQYTVQAERKTGKEAKSQIRNECSDEFLDWWQYKQGYIAC